MNVLKQIEALDHLASSSQYKGYDPYDALNSPILDALSLQSKIGRIGVIQVMRRLPINLRPMLLVKKGHNPKGIGLFLWGYAKLYKITGDSRYLSNIDNLMDILDNLKSRGYSGNCWGYNFNWQSKAFFVPKWTPTIVNSSFIGHALLDAYRFTGNQRALDMAMPIKEFIINDLNRTIDGDTFCFSYTPTDKLIVHNANLLGASLLIRLNSYYPDDRAHELALTSLGYSMKHQKDDGSWNYAETNIQQWIDSFHTGFNLQAMSYFLEQGEATEYKDAYQRGVRFYADNFFLKDGTPKYYHDRVYPIDIHAPAQAIVFFSREGGEYQSLADLVMKWMVDNLYDNKNGYFYFRKGRFMRNKVLYMRWVQSWAFHALTEYYLDNKERA